MKEQRTPFELPRIARWLKPSWILGIAGMAWALLILRSDLWMGDEAIIRRTNPEWVWQSWVPEVLWSASHVLAHGQPAVFQIWNAFALLGLGMAVYRWLSYHMELTLGEGRGTWVGLLAGLVAMVHPVVTTSSCVLGNLGWILAVVFALLAAEQAARWMQNLEWGHFALTLLLFLLASGSAPVGFPLALASVLMSWALAGELAKRRVADWMNQVKRGKMVWLTLAVIAIIGQGAMLERAWQSHTTSVGGDWASHWLTQGRVFGYQLQSLFVPTELLPAHAIPVSEHWQDLPAVVGLCLLIGMTVTGWLVWTRLKNAWPRLLLAMVLLALVPSLLTLGWRTVEPLSEVRWVAVIPWLAMLLALGTAWLAYRWKAMILPFGMGVPALLGFLSLGQMANYHDAERIALLVLKKEPHHLQVRYFLQEHAVQQEQWSRVLKASQPTEQAYRAMVDYNQNNPWQRRHDLIHAMRWWVRGEQLVQQAMEQNYGADYARAYAAHAATKFSQEIKVLAYRQPAALPLLSLITPTVEAPAESKARPSVIIPGISPIAADQP
jgi:hypothetical protein